MSDVETVAVPQVIDAADLMPDTDETEIEIINPRSKKGTGIFITVASRDSDIYRGVQRKQGDNRLKSIGRRTGSSNITSEEIEEEAMQLLIACTRGWRNMRLNGQELTFSTGNVRVVYDKVPTIKEQVDDAIHDRGNFKKR